MSALPQPAVTPAGPLPRSTVDFELLCACCAVEADSARSVRITGLLQLQPAWEELSGQAERHGVVPLLCQNLSQLAAGVPPAVLQQLRQSYERNARKALRLTRELVRILEHLESHGIAVIPYKGPVLAEALYGNIALRQFSDLDILVHRADVPRAKAAVEELGYTPGTKLGAVEERAYLASGYEYTFDSVNGRNLLEIQWQVLPRFYAVDFDLEGFFQRSRAATFCGRQVRTLSTEDLLLVLSVHAAKHAWNRLSLLCDIAEITRSQPINWELVLRQAQTLGIERILLLSVWLCRELFGMPSPALLSPKIQQDNEVSALGNEIRRHLAQGREYTPDSAPYFRLMTRLRERRWDRVRFWLRLASTPSVAEWSQVRLPSPLFPLYRVVRLFRLAGRALSLGVLFVLCG